MRHLRRQPEGSGSAPAVNECVFPNRRTREVRNLAEYVHRALVSDRGVKAIDVVCGYPERPRGLAHQFHALLICRSPFSMYCGLIRLTVLRQGLVDGLYLLLVVRIERLPEALNLRLTQPELMRYRPHVIDKFRVAALGLRHLDTVQLVIVRLLRPSQALVDRVELLGLGVLPRPLL